MCVLAKRLLKEHFNDDFLLVVLQISRTLLGIRISVRRVFVVQYYLIDLKHLGPTDVRRTHAQFQFPK